MLNTDVAQGSNVTPPPNPYCYTSRKTRRILQIPFVESIVYTHSNCPCNELVSLKNIHHRNGPEVDKILMAKVATILFQYLVRYKIDIPRRSTTKVINKYTGPKKRQMIRAAESLRDHPYEPRDANIRLFLKEDKYHYGQVLDKYIPPTIKPARSIQYTNKRYCLSLSRFIQPIEDYIYEYWCDYTNTPIFFKCLDPVRRGNLLVEKLGHFSDPVVLLFDQEKFDSRVNKYLLLLEGKVYSYYNKSNLLKVLFRKQYIIKGWTKNGTTFVVKATRASGQPNTAIGNCIIDFLLLLGYLTLSNVIKWAMGIDGDDSFVIIESWDFARLINIQFFRDMGMVPKLEIVREISQIEFCQARPVQVGINWVMVRNPYRMLARIGWTTHLIPNKKYHLKYVRSLGLCELAISTGIPISQALACKMVNVCKSGYVITDRHYVLVQQGLDPLKSKAQEVLAATRISYEQAWGISVDNQIQYEKGFEELTLTDTGYDDYGNFLQNCPVR